MNWELILSIVLAIGTIVSVFLNFYFSAKATAEHLATDAIDDAEKTKESNEKKFNSAVDQIYSALPSVIRPFITRTAVEKIVQHAFNKIKSYSLERSKKEE